MKLYVIMGNDFPAGVCDSAEKAEAAIVMLKKQDVERAVSTYGYLDGRYQTPIHYRWYDFTLNEVS